MLSRRLLLGGLLLLGLVAGSIAAARYAGQNIPRPYNCMLVYDDVQVHLNTHLTRHEWPKYPSPDRRYVAGRMDGTGSYNLFVESVVTGARRIFLRDMLYIHRLAWSPDSRFIYALAEDHAHAFHAVLVTPDGALVGERVLDYAPRWREFSPTGDYLVLAERPGHLAVYATRDFPHTVIEHPAEMESVTWSQNGERAAFADRDRIIVVDAVAGTIHRAAIEPDINNPVSILWAADNRHLAVANRFQSTLHLFALSDGSPAALLPVGFKSIASRSLLGMYWQTGEDRLFYFTTQVTETATTYALWRYDLDTQRATLAASDLRAYWLGRDTVVTLRSSRELEFWPRDGSDSRVAYTFQHQVLDLANPVFMCEWTLRSSSRPLLYCHDWRTRTFSLLFDESGTLIWSVDDVVEHIAPSYVGGEWLVTLARHNDGEISGEMLNLATLQTHELPALLLDTVPDSAFEQAHRFDLGNQYPALDGESWLVTFNQGLYRFWPDETHAGDRWETIYPDGILDRVFWSPDGERYAFFRAGNLTVRETDGSAQWTLGRFHRAWPWRWGRCGNVLAPLRDWLAAESPP